VTDIAMLIGRLLFGGLFLYNGVNHFRNRAALVGYAQYKKVPAPAAGVVVSGLWLTISGLSVMAGIRPHAGALMIAAFLIVVSPMMHDYWKAADDNTRMNDFLNFTKNLALAGAALMLLSIPEPWAFSLMP
jgi:putative oxidoreductase